MPTKTSIGVILCRRNVKTGHPEALLAHKRYTYAFAEFVHGRYARGRAGSNAALRCVAPLFDYMTREELFDILSLNFEQMWYRIWLTLDNRDLYNKKCAKFQSTFMRDDGGAALRRLVMLARANGVLLWEVPRGRRLNAREADILCATRELHEETGVEKSEYRFLPGIKRRVSYVSAGTRYTCAYYVALANPHLANAVSYDDPTRPTLREINLMAEVSEVRWHDIERIRLIDSADSRLESLVAPAFRLMKQYLKGRWAARRHAGAPPTTVILPSGPAAPVAVAPAALIAGAPKATCNYDPPRWSQAARLGGDRGKRRERPPSLAHEADCDWRIVARGRPARPKSGP
jgi:8-oxo-dGTP pyrophosphatase MutT (NUDIX family)